MTPVREVIVVNELDEVQGHKTREQLQPNDCWRMAALWVTDSKDSERVLLFQRGPTSRWETNLRVTPANGSVLRGETYVDTMRRELQEQLGVQGADLKLGPVQVFANPAGDRRVCQWFVWQIADGDEGEFVVDRTQIEDMQWWDMPALRRTANEVETGCAHYLTDFIRRFQRC